MYQTMLVARLMRFQPPKSDHRGHAAIFTTHLLGVKHQVNVQTCHGTIEYSSENNAGQTASLLVVLLR